MISRRGVLSIPARRAIEAIGRQRTAVRRMKGSIMTAPWMTLVVSISPLTTRPARLDPAVASLDFVRKDW